ncbi:V-type ATPase subunit [Peptoniphilus genitalis]
MFEGLKALNAKILKMYSDFLVYDDFVNMAEGDSVRFCLNYLKEKKFPTIDSFSDIYEIEEFLEDYRRRQIKKLQAFLPGKYSDFIKAYMEREKIEKIVKILRALRMNKEPRVDKLIIGAKSIPFKEESFESFIDNLRDTPYYEYMKNYKSSTDEEALFSIEMNLDKFYYRNLTESVKSLSKKDHAEFKNIFGVKIDLLNIIWIYRAKKYYDISPEEIFNFTIFGGNYNSEKLLHLSYLEEEEFEEEIKNSKYSILFADGRVIRLVDVSKIYGELKALDKINLSVEKGEWISIMGPSGSGKTTMMNIIGAMDKPSLGEVILDGEDIAKKSPKELTVIRRDKIGLIFQQFHLVNYLSALENVMMSQYYHSMPDAQEAMEALAAVGLADRAKHLPNQLSGGEQQRVCIARALINHPAILLADEPTGNLDEKNEYIVLDIFEKLHNAGSTIIVVTHDPEVGEESERMITLEHGKITKEEKMKRKRPVLDSTIKDEKLKEFI